MKFFGKGKNKKEKGINKEPEMVGDGELPEKDREAIFYVYLGLKKKLELLANDYPSKRKKLCEFLASVKLSIFNYPDYTVIDQQIDGLMDIYPKRLSSLVNDEAQRSSFPPEASSAERPPLEKTPSAPRSTWPVPEIEPVNCEQLLKKFTSYMNLFKKELKLTQKFHTEVMLPINSPPPTGIIEKVARAFDIDITDVKRTSDEMQYFSKELHVLYLSHKFFNNFFMDNSEALHVEFQVSFIEAQLQLSKLIRQLFLEKNKTVEVTRLHAQQKEKCRQDESFLVEGMLTATFNKLTDIDPGYQIEWSKVNNAPTPETTSPQIHYRVTRPHANTI